VVSYYEKLIQLFWLMRPLNSITAGIAVITATFLANSGNNSPFLINVYLGMGFAAFFTTAQAMVHNDIVDIEADKINYPSRALPSGKISPIEAKLFAFILFIFACIAGIYIDAYISINFPISLFWAFLNSILLDIYNKWIKRSGLIGNLIVAYVVWALFIYADIVINQRLTLLTQSIGLYAFFWNWGREIFKDIMDIEGDREFGLNTIPVRYGAKNGAYIGTFFIIIAIIWSIPIILLPNPIMIPILLISIDFIILYKSIQIIRKLENEYIYKSKRLFMRLMFLAVIIIGLSNLI